MIDLSVIRDLVAIFGVIAGLSYYVLTVRNARRVRKEAWAREFSEFNLEEHSIFMELLLMEWNNFDDYVSKYDSTVNLDNYSKRSLIWNRLNRMGYELFQGNVDIETIYNYTGYQNFWFLWNKLRARAQRPIPVVKSFLIYFILEKVKNRFPNHHNHSQVLPFWTVALTKSSETKNMFYLTSFPNGR